MPDAPPTTHLDVFCQSLHQTLGERLASIVLYGDLVKPDQFVESTSTAELMIVVRDADTATLESIAPAVLQLERKLRVGLIVVTPEDLAQSCDVFPIRFLDMQTYHELLFGEDLLSELEFSDQHLRLRCEQELKNLQLRLRNLFVHRQGRPKLLGETLANASHTIFRILAASLAIRSGVVVVGDEAVINGAVKQLGCDAELLRVAAKLKQGEIPDRREELLTAFNAVMTTVTTAAAAVDAMETECSSNDDAPA